MSELRAGDKVHVSFDSEVGSDYGSKWIEIPGVGYWPLDAIDDRMTVRVVKRAEPVSSLGLVKTEADYDALPVGSVVAGLNSGDWHWTKTPSGDWSSPGVKFKPSTWLANYDCQRHILRHGWSDS